MATSISAPKNNSTQQLPSIPAGAVTPASAADGNGFTWSVVGESATGDKLEFLVRGNGNSPTNTTSGNALSSTMLSAITNQSTYITVNASYGGKSDLNNWQVSAASTGGSQQQFKRGTGGGKGGDDAVADKRGY